MAYVTSAKTFEAGVFERSSAALKSLPARYAQFRLYRRTVAELSALSTRDLADLGLSRAQIRTVAREAAYGA